MFTERKRLGLYGNGGSTGPRLVGIKILYGKATEYNNFEKYITDLVLTRIFVSQRLQH